MVFEKGTASNHPLPDSATVDAPVRQLRSRAVYSRAGAVQQEEGIEEDVEGDEVLVAHTPPHSAVAIFCPCPA